MCPEIDFLCLVIVMTESRCRPTLTVLDKTGVVATGVAVEIEEGVDTGETISTDFNVTVVVMGRTGSRPRKESLGNDVLYLLGLIT